MNDYPFQDEVENQPKPSSQHDEEGAFAYPTWVRWGVFFFSFLILVMVVIQMRQRFRLVIPTFGDGAQQLGDLSQSLLDQSDEELKNQDSDEDGLSDYDELNVHKSSPFIADTDSDGISDADEVAAGSNPSCPEGQDCFQRSGLADSGGDVGPLFATSAFGEAELQDALSDPQKIRSLLLQTGADPQLVKSLDDQTLQILAQDALSEISQTPEEKATTLGQLDPAELRQLLLEAGADPIELEGLSDEELLQISQQAIQEQFSNQDTE